MARGRKIIRIVLLSAACLVAATVAAVEILLHTAFVSRTVDSLAAESLDAELSYKGISASLFRNFPDISVSVDTLALVYPHERFSVWDGKGIRDSRREAGRSAVSDTLLRFDRLSARVNIWPLITGRVRVGDIHLHGLGLYAHAYPDSTANWMVFKPSEQTEKDSTAALTLPRLDFKRVSIAEGTRIVYTSPADSIFADLACDHLLSSASLRLRKGDIELKDFSVDFDAVLNARKEPLGSFCLPLTLTAMADAQLDHACKQLDLESLDANLAHIPLHAEGNGRVYADSTVLDISASVDGCPVETLLRSYADVVSIASRGLRTNALLDIDATIKGVMSGDTYPDLKARLRIPRSSISYTPYGIKGSMELDCNAVSDSRRLAKATLDGLNLRINGADLTARGSADDVLGADPRIRFGLGGFAQLDSLYSLFFSKDGMTAKGRLDISLDADANLSDLNAVSFKDASVKGHIAGDEIHLASDTLALHAFRPVINLKSGVRGLYADVFLDSLHYTSETGLHARLRDMKNYAIMDKVESDGQMVPHIQFTTNDGRAFFRSGNIRAGVRNSTITAAVQKRVAADKPKRNGPLSGAPRQHDFADKDIRFALDSAMRVMLKEWVPSMYVEAENGFASLPMLPLRTRVSNVNVVLNDNLLDIASLDLVSGTSDIHASGSVKGLRSLAEGKGFLRFDMLLTSNYINANELIAAVQHGRTLDVDASKMAENDESFVTDSLVNVVPDSLSSTVIVVPRNMKGSLNVRLSEVNYGDLNVKPFRTRLNVGRGVLQVTDTRAEVTDIGSLDMNAFYATKSRNDISAGIDARLENISARGLIHLLPFMDNMIPALKSFEGNLNCELAARTALDTCMNVLMPTLDGAVRISGDRLHISDAGSLRKITGLLMFKDRDIGDISDLNVNAVVHDNRIEVFPFELGVDRYKFALQGVQDFDGGMKYHVSVLRSPLLIPFGINIYGKTSGWKFNIGPAKYRNGRVPVNTEHVDSVQASTSRYISDILNKDLSKTH